MTDPVANRSDALVRLSLESDRARRAKAVLAAERRSLEGAVKRTLPYLVRKKIKVEATAPQAVLWSDALAALVQPMHITSIDINGTDRKSVV